MQYETIHKDSDTVLHGFTPFIFSQTMQRKWPFRNRDYSLPSIYRVRCTGSIAPKGFLIFPRPLAAELNKKYWPGTRINCPFRRVLNVAGQNTTVLDSFICFAS